MGLKPDFHSLKEQLAAKIDASRLKTYLCLRDFDSGRTVQINGRQRFYPASLIKLLLLQAFLREVESGRLLLESTHTLTEADRYAGRTKVTGSGVLQFAETGTVCTLKQLLAYMITISDNVATNILYDRVGPARIRETARETGLSDTAFNRRMYELDSPLPSNHSTACDLTEILAALYSGEAAGGEYSALAIKLLAAAADKDRIGRYLDKTVIVANKSGTVSGIVGDAALLFFPCRPPAALTIAVADPTDVNSAAHLIGCLAKIAVQHLESSESRGR